MKRFTAALLFLIPFAGSAQTQPKQQVLDLSKKIFQWEVNGSIDSLESVFHPDFQVIGSNGEAQMKAQYLARLRLGNFIHNSIQVLEENATVAGNTATVAGKGKFAVTVNGQKVGLRLSYLEVFTRLNTKQPWKVLAMHASALSEDHP